MKPITRLGDLCTGHNCYPSRPSITASPNVFVNEIPVHRVGDQWNLHDCPGCTPHGGVLVAGSTKVFVNGRGVGRVGDEVSCGSRVMTGSGNVFCR